MQPVCELLEQPAQPAVAIRTWTSAGDLPRVLGQTFSSLAQFLAEKGTQPSGPPFVAYYNMDMQNLDIEIGFPVPEKLEGQGAVRPSRIPGGRLAACTYTGPYQDLAPAYDALSRMVQERGLKATGVAYEIYLNDPQTTPPQELQTRILFPLKG